MSSFYTVNTTNAFAALDLSDDGERILSGDKLPKEETAISTPAPVVDEPEETTRPSTRNFRGGGRGGRRGGGDVGGGNERADGERGNATGGDDAQSEKFNGRGGAQHNRRGGRTELYPARDGKRTFDRKSSPAQMKKPEDVNPDHEQADAEEANRMAKSEDRNPEEPVVEAEDESKKRVEFYGAAGVQAYLDTLKASQDKPVTVTSETHSDLSREIADAGFRVMSQKPEDCYTKNRDNREKSRSSGGARETLDMSAAMSNVSKGFAKSAGAYRDANEFQSARPNRPNFSNSDRSRGRGRGQDGGRSPNGSEPSAPAPTDEVRITDAEFPLIG